MGVADSADSGGLDAKLTTRASAARRTHREVRVVYVNHTSTLGGAERSLLTLLAGLKTEIEAYLACPEGRLADEARQLGVSVLPLRGTAASLRFNLWQTVAGLVGILRSSWELRRAARRVSPDIVHANSIRAGLIALALPMGSRRIVVHARDCLPASRAANVIRRVLRRADLVISNSQYTLRNIALDSRYARSAARSVVVYNAIDLQVFKPNPQMGAQARQALGFEASDALVGIVGQITPWKGQAEAIQAVGLLRSAHPELHLLLVGSVKFGGKSTRFDNNRYQSSLHELVHAYELDGRVHFLGERADVPAIMAALDLVLVPSWEEPFGRVVIEAMAMELAVIATNIGGPSEIISDGENGLLLDPHEPKLWASSIGSLLADAGRRERLGRAARVTAKKSFGQLSHTRRMLDVYRNLLAAPRR